jgi:D-alanyl-D-alanine carboxypeptidase (penicillin-binding protein 5/6)
VSGRRRVQILAAVTVTLAMAVAVVSARAASPPASTADAVPPPALSTRAAILVAEGTGERLYGMNADASVPIASATKLMTALVTLERAPLTATFPYPGKHFTPDASQIGLSPGERMSVYDLLVAALVPSADDAALDLAYNIGQGSVPRFVAMMNARALQLGLRHTHYSTPIGFDDPGNYSSAADLVRLAAYVLQRYPVFAHIVSLSTAVLHSGNQPRTVVSRNGLVGAVPWIHGVKTGHTAGAGYVLVGLAQRNGMTLLSAVLGTASEGARDQNTLALLNWGYANYRQTEPVAAGAVLARPTVADQPGKRPEVIAGRTLTEVVARSSHVILRIRVPHQITGPLKQNSVVGSATVLDNGRRLDRVPLVLARALPGVSAWTLIGRFITEPITLLVLVMLIGGTATLIARRRPHRRQRERTPA